jgi:hypothetical protein
MSLGDMPRYEARAMLRSKIPPDRSKIELHHPDEVKYWSRHLRITADELQRVIEKVGNAAATVRKELRLTNMPSTPTA